MLHPKSGRVEHCRSIKRDCEVICWLEGRTMHLDDEDFCRARMLEELVRAQSSLGEVKQFHLRWAALYEGRLRELALPKEKPADRKRNLGRALNGPASSYDAAWKGHATT